MTRCNSGADSIVWIEEGTQDRTRVAVWIHAPETFFCFRDFLSASRVPAACFCAPVIIQPEGVFVAADMNINPLLVFQSASRRRRRLWLRVLSLLLGLLCWQVTARFTGVEKFILPPPIAVWERFLEAVWDGSIFIDIGVTLVEVLGGLLIGVFVATMLGYSVAKSRALERMLSPYLVASQAIPIVAVAPLLVLWFGQGLFSKLLICALIVFFPVLINTIVGIRAVPNAFYDLMNSLRATRRQILLKVEVPAALPIFLGGLRIGATLSVIGAVVGELVGANYGLGNLITRGRLNYDMPLVYVGVFMLVIMALCLYAVVSMLEKKFLKWQESFEK